MSFPFSGTSLRLPAGFQNLLEGLALEVLRAQPTDVAAFAAQHFQTLLEQREGSSAVPAARGARLEDEPPSQEPTEEDEAAGQRAGGVATADTVREAPPAPQTGLSPNQRRALPAAPAAPRSPPRTPVAEAGVAPPPP